MIVEDNELNMKLFDDLLGAHGYDTIKTRDGTKVMDLARQHRPDLIVMDIQLPEVSGLEDPAGRLRGLCVETHFDHRLHENRAEISRKVTSPNCL